ncbi:unnamed protein product [Mucor hiemalis]
MSNKPSSPKPDSVDMTDVSNWTEEDKINFILAYSELDQLPKNYHLLHNKETAGTYRTCDGCYTAKHKSEFSKKQWKSTDQATYCMKCLAE